MSFCGKWKNSSPRGWALLACAAGMVALAPVDAFADPEEDSGQQADRATFQVFGRTLNTVINRSVQRQILIGRGIIQRTDAGDSTQQVVTGTDGAQVFSGPFSIYANAAYSNHDVKLRDLRSDEDVYTGLIGIDAFAHEKLLLGISVGYTDLRNDQLSNFVGGQFNTRTRSDTLTLAVYGAYITTDTTFVDVSFGYHQIDRSQQTFSVATGAPIFAASADDDAYFIGANFNYINTFGSWTVGGLIGFQATRVSESGFTDSIGGLVAPKDKRMDALFTAKAEVGYRFDKIRPYTSIAYEHSPSTRQISVGAGAASGLEVNDDRSNVRLALGVDVDVGPFTLSAELQTVQLYKQHDEVGGFVNAKFNF